MAFPRVFGPLAGPIPTSYIDDNFNALSAPTGTTNIGYQSSLAGAVPRTQAQINDETISVMRFGALGDGVTDDTAAFNLTHIAAALLNACVYMPGTVNGYKLAGTLALKASMRGDGILTRLITSSATLDVMQCGVKGVTLSDFQITTSVTRTAGYYINFNADNSDCHVRNVRLTNYFDGIGLTGTVSAFWSLKGLVMQTTSVTGTAVRISTTGNSVALGMEDVIIGAPAASNTFGVSVLNCGDLTLRSVNTAQCGVGLQLIPPNGKTIQVVMVSDSLYDSGASYGVLTDPAAGGTVQLLKMVNVWACTNTHGVLLNPSGTGLTQRVELINMTMSNNTSKGLYVNGATVTNVLALGGSAAANVDGIFVVAPADRITIANMKLGSNGQFGPNSGYGINLNAGVTTNISILGNDLNGNTTGTILDGSTGAGKLFRDNAGWGYGSNSSFDPPNLVAGAGATTTVTVTGAVVGDVASASFSNDLQGITLTAWVSAANTVSSRFQNQTAGALDLASGALRNVIERRT